MRLAAPRLHYTTGLIAGRTTISPKKLSENFQFHCFILRTSFHQRITFGYEHASVSNFKWFIMTVMISEWLIYSILNRNDNFISLSVNATYINIFQISNVLNCCIIMYYYYYWVISKPMEWNEMHRLLTAKRSSPFSFIRKAHKTAHNHDLTENLVNL